MNRLDIVIDLETLSTSNNPVIVQIGAVAFDIKTGAKIREFNLPIDIQSCIDAGLKIDALTLKWWLKQNKEVINDVFNGTVKLNTALKDFAKWIQALTTEARTIKSGVHLWGNGILADNAWLKGAYESLKIPYPIHYKNDRDIRTLLEIAAKSIEQPESIILSKISQEGKKHNAIDDARWAAKLISTCWNLIVR